MNLDHIYFEKIHSGRKVTELRLFDKKRQGIKVGDVIEFTDKDTGKKLQVTVTELITAPDLDNLLAKGVTPQELGFISQPEVESVVESIYGDDKIQEFGLLAIRFKFTPNGLGGIVDDLG